MPTKADIQGVVLCPGPPLARPQCNAGEELQISPPQSPLPHDGRDNQRAARAMPGENLERGKTLTRLATLATLSRSAGEGPRLIRHQAPLPKAVRGKCNDRLFEDLPPRRGSDDAPLHPSPPPLAAGLSGENFAEQERKSAE